MQARITIIGGATIQDQKLGFSPIDVAVNVCPETTALERAQWH